MAETVQFLLRHENLVLFGVVFVEQIGVPLLAIPFLFAAGALRMSPEELAHRHPEIPRDREIILYCF